VVAEDLDMLLLVQSSFAGYLAGWLVDNCGHP
jgi:hypothetical protein